MNDVEQQAIQTYQKNIAYLKETNTETYKKLTLLEKAIELGQYQEKYSLEYTSENYFDVKEIQSGNFLYDTNSIEYSQILVNSVDSKKTGGVFHAQKFVDFSPDMVETIDKSKLDFHNALWATIKIIDYTRRFSLKPSASMSTVYKTIFIDIGLGLHVKDIIKKLNSQIIYIKEDNLELFRLSLFVTDFSLIAKNKILIFSVSEQEAEQRDSFVKFLDHGNNYNLHIKHIPFTKNYESQLQKFQSYVLSQNYMLYGYSGILLRSIDSAKYLPQGYPFINVNKTYLKTVFSKKPVLLLFSGPSSSKHIDWIIENRDRFILVTALSTCRLLNKYNITPDVVVHIDPGKKETLALFKDIDTKTFFKQTICILSSNVDETTVKKFNKKNVFFIEQGTNYKKDFGNFTSASVGEYTYAIFLLFGATNMFLLGLDLALDTETLKTHGEFHPFTEQGEVTENTSSLSYKTAIVYTRGNFIEQVPTLTLYKISIGEFARFTNMVKRQDHKVYNLGNGAYLEGAQPLHVKDFNWKKLKKLDRKKTFKDLSEFFNNISSSVFREEDKTIIRYQINEAKNIEDAIHLFAKQAIDNKSNYLSFLSTLSLNISDMEKTTHSDLAQVYYEYFQIILSYIFDMFNTKNLENPELRVEEIHNILVGQLLKISKTYIESLEEYLK